MELESDTWPLHDIVITNIVMCIADKTGGRKGSRILSNNRAIVLHQGGQCRWARGKKGWLIRAQQPRNKRISCKGHSFTWCRRIPSRCLICTSLRARTPATHTEFGVSTFGARIKESKRRARDSRAVCGRRGGCEARALSV